MTCKISLHVHPSYRTNPNPNMAIPWCDTHDQPCVTLDHCQMGIWEEMQALEKRIEKLEKDHD